MQQWNWKKILNKKVFAISLLAIIALFCFSFFAVARAQTGSAGTQVQEGLNIIQKPLGLPATDIRVIAARIIRIALGLLGIVLLVLILYGGFLWMTAGGNDEQIGKAKKILINAIIGLIIIFCAYAIVMFVMHLLGLDQNGSGGNNTAGGPPGTQNYYGSGALGQIIKDHYPYRDQTDVPRNTKIIVTFRHPVLASSFIDDTNHDGVFGDCRPNMTSWVDDCDRIKTAAGGVLSDNIINIKTDAGPIAAGAILASTSTINGITGVYTIVIKPITNLGAPDGGYLGSASENVQYNVRLGNNILLDDAANHNPPAFNASSLGNDYYDWNFTTNNSLDLIPPVVTSVYPASGTVQAKNSVIQINFSKPMDPTGIQGKFLIGANEYDLEGNNIYLKSDHSLVPTGNFILTNGYKTLEFESDHACGKNACGGTIYCLPVCDRPGSVCAQDAYQVLLKAGRTINPASFEAIPFSGVMDVSGNAMDGNANAKTDLASSALPVFPAQQQPDNYFWDFGIKNEIDLTAPYLQRVTPGLDAQNIPASQQWSMYFSKRMRAESLYSIGIDQQPPQPIPLCLAPRATFDPAGTSVDMYHCPFLTGQQEYYYPLINSGVEDVNYNCFYPGRGPNTLADPTNNSAPCDEAAGGCCAVLTTKNFDFCCNGAVNATQNSQQSCLNFLKANSL